MPYGPVTAARAAAYPLSAAPALCALRENGLGAKRIFARIRRPAHAVMPPRYFQVRHPISPAGRLPVRASS
jgi:hypothetical protein